jgi:hypothetical protein
MVIANCNDGKIRHYDSNDIVLKRNDTLKLNDKSNYGFSCKY